MRGDLEGGAWVRPSSRTSMTSSAVWTTRKERPPMITLGEREHERQGPGTDEVVGGRVTVTHLEENRG